MTREAISAMRSEASHACPRCHEPMREIEITRGNDVDKNGPAPLVWMGPSTGTRITAEGFFQATRDGRLQLLAEYRGFWIHETAYRWIDANVPPFAEWCDGSGVIPARSQVNAGKALAVEPAAPID